jgi:phage-related protein
MAAKKPPVEPPTEPEKVKPGPRLGCRFYRNEGGTEPVRDWLLGLEANVRKEIGSDIKNVQLRWPLSKPLVDGFGEGFYEVRTSHDKNIYRVLFCIVGATMVLLHGFMKKSQATPKQDKEVARKRQRDVEGAA